MENYNNELMNNVEVIEPTAENFVVVEAINEESTKGLFKTAAKGLLISGALIGAAYAINKFVVPVVAEKLEERRLRKQQEMYEQGINGVDEFDDEDL